MYPESRKSKYLSCKSLCSSVPLLYEIPVYYVLAYQIPAYDGLPYDGVTLLLRTLFLCSYVPMFLYTCILNPESPLGEGHGLPWGPHPLRVKGHGLPWGPPP